MEHEARFYEADADGSVRCHLCGHHCVIPDGKVGLCRVRKNIGGTLCALSYGQVISQCVDPIEKKPLYHFYPGSKAYSIATLGCNFHCKWCQNWHISQIQKGQPVAVDRYVPPSEIVADAQYTGSRSIAYTYTEPTVFFEYAYDTAQLAHEAGLANVYVTNGYMSAEMLDAFQKTLDGANVDLKAFRKETYQRYIGARLQTVLDSLVKMKELGIWLEVTTLVVPDVNDDPDELQEMANYISQELGVDTPWHISRFFPYYRMTDRPPTSIATLQRAQDIGFEAGLRYVYVGNVSGGNETICPDCGQVLIRRYGYAVSVEGLSQDRCGNCGTSIAGVW